MKRNFVLLIFLTLSLLSVNGQNSLNNTKATSQNDTTTFSEAKAYKMLYDNQIKANDGILKTIFYALGGLGTAVLLVFGSNWWFNDKKVRDVIKEIDNKIKEVKKDAMADVSERINILSTGLKSDFNQSQAKLQEVLTNNVSDLTLRFNEFTEKLRAEIKEDNKDLSDSHQKQLESFNENYRQQISIFNNTLNSHYSSVMEIINGKETSLRELILLEQKNRIDQYNDISQKMHRVEFYMWRDSGVFRNAFKALLDELEYMLKIKRTPQSYSLRLTQMLDTLDKCTYILKGDQTTAIELISKIPDSDILVEIRENVLKKLNQITVND